MSNIASEMLAGTHPNIFSFFDTVQARARLRAGKGQDKDGTTNESSLCHPYYAVLQIRLWFIQLYLEPDKQHPEQ